MARKRYSDEHQSRAITSTHLHQNNAFEPCFLTPFAKIYWHSSRGLRQLHISGRLKLVYDATARGHDIPSHCTDCDCEGGVMIGAFVVWLGHEK